MELTGQVIVRKLNDSSRLHLSSRGESLLLYTNGGKRMENDASDRTGHISMRKVRVHNLKSIDLDLPYNKLIAFCGLSGSGKSSLAVDTLYAEGQRRYIESFSAYTRQFLEKIEKPDVEEIDGLPPAIAVTSRPLSQMSRSTIGTMTETNDYLRLLFARIGTVRCQNCGREVRQDSPDSVLKSLVRLKDGMRLIIAFSPDTQTFKQTIPEFESEWTEAGFQRGIVLGETFRLDEGGIPFSKFADARLLSLADVRDEEHYGSEDPSGEEFFRSSPGRERRYFGRL